MNEIDGSRRRAYAPRLAACIVLGALVFTWTYVRDREQSAAERRAASQADLQWLIEALGREPPKPAGAPMDDMQALGVLQRSAEELGLRESISRLNPAPPDQVTVEITELEFDVTMRWLAGLATTHGIELHRLDLRSAPALGKIKGSITLHYR